MAERLFLGHYYGGKLKRLNMILPLLPESRVYVEPFGGAASVLLNKPPSEVEVYNDAFWPMVALFHEVRDDHGRMATRLFLTPNARRELKASPLDGCDDLELARRMAMRLTIGFSGESHKIANTTWSRQTRRRTIHRMVTMAERLPAISQRMQGVALLNQDALDVIREYDSPETLFYVDPPYVHDTRGSSHNYGQHEAGREFHKRLLTALRRAKGQVVLSGYASRLYDKRLASWDRMEDKERQTASGQLNTEGSPLRTEVIWRNWGRT